MVLPEGTRVPAATEPSVAVQRTSPDTPTPTGKRPSGVQTGAEGPAPSSVWVIPLRKSRMRRSRRSPFRPMTNAMRDASGDSRSWEYSAGSGSKGVAIPDASSHWTTESSPPGQQRQTNLPVCDASNSAELYMLSAMSLMTATPGSVSCSRSRLNGATNSVRRSTHARCPLARYRRADPSSLPVRGEDARLAARRGTVVITTFALSAGVPRSFGRHGERSRQPHCGCSTITTSCSQ